MEWSERELSHVTWPDGLKGCTSVSEGLQLCWIVLKRFSSFVISCAIGLPRPSVNSWTEHWTGVASAQPLGWWRTLWIGSMFTQELLFCRVLPSLYLWIFKCWRGWRKGSARSHSSPPWEDEKPWTMAICCLVVRQWEGNRWPFAPLRKAVPVVRKAGFSYWILRPRLIACWVAALVVNVVTSSQVNIVNSDEAVSGFYPSSVGWTVGVQRSEDGWWAPTRCRWSSSWCPSAGQLGCHWWPADCWWWYIPVDETELTEVEKKIMKKKNKLKTKPTKAQMQRPARIASYQPSPQFSDFPRLPPTSTPRRRVPSRSCRIWDRWSISSSPTSEVQRL